MAKNQNKTSYLIKDIDAELWLNFRATAMTRGFSSAKECLISLIKEYTIG